MMVLPSCALDFQLKHFLFVYLTVVDSNKVKNLERQFIANQSQIFFTTSTN